MTYGSRQFLPCFWPITSFHNEATLKAQFGIYVNTYYTRASAYYTNPVAVFALGGSIIPKFFY